MIFQQLFILKIIVLFDSYFAAGAIGLKIEILISALCTSPTSSVQYVYSGQLKQSGRAWEY